MTAWATSSISGLGHTHHTGANTARIGSTWAPRRLNCAPDTSVVENSPPWATLHTA